MIKQKPVTMFGLITALLLLAVMTVSAQGVVELQGEIVNGRFLVPMRSIFENLGATVEWDDATRTVTGHRGETTVSLVIDNRNATVNGRMVELDVPAQIVGGRTYVPTRFVGEALGADVSWDPDTRSATITLDETVIVVYQDRSPVVTLPPPGEQQRVTYTVIPAFVPEGGGRPVTLTVKVVDDEGLPMEGTHVSFFAESLEDGSRQAQLSVQDVQQTDESGMASVTYTTLARDDQRQVSIRMTTSVAENEWVEKDHVFVASSTAARVEGTVRNPFTGTPSSGSGINFGLENSDRRYYAETDALGRYSIMLPKGSYNLDVFNIDTRGASPAISQSYAGSHHRITTSGIEWNAVKAEVTQAGTTMILDYNMGILWGTISGRGSGTTLAIIPESNGSLIQSRTVLAELASDGSFMIPLPPGNYSLFMGGANPFMRNVPVTSGQANDLGTVSAN